jgi:hypothetical protein
VAAQVHACALVTKAEVEAAVGTPVLAGVEEQLPQHSGCGFGDPDAPKIGGKVVFRLVSVSVLTFATPSAAHDVFVMGKGNAATPQAVTGVGDEAFWDALLHTLWVRKGKYELSIDVPKAGGLAAAKAIAAKALTQLP